MHALIPTAAASRVRTLGRGHRLLQPPDSGLREVEIAAMKALLILIGAVAIGALGMALYTLWPVFAYLTGH